MRNEFGLALNLYELDSYNYEQGCIMKEIISIIILLFSLRKCNRAYLFINAEVSKISCVRINGVPKRNAHVIFWLVHI